MMNLRKLLGCFLALLVARSGAEPMPPEILPEVREQLRAFESLPPKEALERYREWMRFNRRFEDEAEARLARNPQLPAWLTKYFKETPVLFENYAERNSIIMTIRGLPAEWVVRFLTQLSLDERPMKSTRYDYDDPEFQTKMRAALESIDGWDDTGDLLFQRFGYGPPGGDNRTLALDGLRVIREAVLLAQERRGVQNPSVTGTAGLSPDSPRISDLAKDMWGGKAILNQELGLGPDNAPLRLGSINSAVMERGRQVRPPVTGADAADESGSTDTVARKASKHVLLLACGLLAAALAAVGWRRFKAG